jgi:hypothetical protein
LDARVHDADDGTRCSAAPYPGPRSTATMYCSGPHPRGLVRNDRQQVVFKFMPHRSAGPRGWRFQADNTAFAVEVPRLVGSLRPWWPELKLPIIELIDMNHISDYDLERHHLGTVRDEAELAKLEEHLLGCLVCVGRAEEAAVYVDALRAAIVAGYFDLKCGSIH